MGKYAGPERRIYPYAPMTPEREEEVWRSKYPSQTEQEWIDTLDTARDEIAAERARAERCGKYITLWAALGAWVAWGAQPIDRKVVLAKMNEMTRIDPLCPSAECIGTCDPRAHGGA